MFARSAKRIADELKGEATVLVNEPAKPRKGCFVVTVKGSTVVSLEGLPRPFTKLRELDFANVVSEIRRLLLV